jgi:uracil-DNA glycosylase
LLVMGEILNKTLAQAVTELKFPVQTTYHPAELQQLPDNKKKAYRDLLVLKEQLLRVRRL